ncbi:Transposase [bioreactor metagenome]|uniref:Transposase n=1 Tax=bioreactor metagenome TaxID=1076179 RepID=A0A645GY53_9ZZZZ
MSEVTKIVAKDKTKNASSFRSFPLTEDARCIFQQAKRQEAENRKLFGKAYQENSYVFKWDNGKLYSPNFIDHHFQKLLAKYGLPHIRFHELRHSCASLLLNAGFTLKDVQEWMGHADIKMTANIYGHLDVSRKKNMAQQLSGSLFEMR